MADILDVYVSYFFLTKMNRENRTFQMTIKLILFQQMKLIYLNIMIHFKKMEKKS